MIGGNRLTITMLACAMILTSWHAQAQEVSSDRVIVKLRSTATKSASATWRSVSTRSGMALTQVRTLANGAQMIRVTPGVNADTAARQLASDPDVAYAEPDRLMEVFSTPNDAYYGSQWNLAQDTADVISAWDVTQGASDIVVAVLDTGVLPHEDLTHLLPGYDFVSADSSGTFLRANDGDGRDSDATDPGDWVTFEESQAGLFTGCRVQSSSWHGTHVTGIVGAAGNNAKGIAGVNWSSTILPVRVLGKCGGFLSDIIDGMYWAAGLPVADAPINPNPARVLNLSLGAPTSTCSSAYQEAIQTLAARGVVVVSAAGNSNTNASGVTPANCPGVITVAATNRANDRAWYSNFGSVVAIAAPGGQMYYANDPDGIWSTLNAGSTVAGSDTYAPYQGTSMAAAHVSGVVSLMLSVNPSLTPADVSSLLRSTSRPFAADSGCDTTTCGSGVVDAGAAVIAARSAPSSGAPSTDAPVTAISPGASGDSKLATTSGGGGGGCTIGERSVVDPVLPLLALFSLWVVAWRRRSTR